MGNPSHIIVLMFENRSYDHMLGFLPNGGDLTGEEFNLTDPANPESERVFVSNTAGPITPIDPGHEFVDTSTQLFGSQSEIEPAPMSGFVKDGLAHTNGNLDVAKIVMDCHTPQSLPILSTLASEYCLCTRWFPSVPGPTWPNRFFVQAATSAGLVIDNHTDPSIATIQDRLDAQKRTWRVYAGDIPQCLAIDSLLHHFVDDLFHPFSQHHFHHFGQFFADLKHGSLPNYAFLEPHYFETSLWQATDEHPSHDIRPGEALLREVVTSLAASDYWNDSVLVVTYDEHGGFYDRVSPPTGVPNPDGRVSANPPFDFTRLGVRVPAVLISPLIEPGTIDATIYDHTSIPATINHLFGLGPASFLTRRDAAANTFEKNLTRTSPRPTSPLPLAPVATGPRRHEIARLDLTLRQTIGMVLEEMQSPRHSLNGLQQSLLQLARGIMPHL